MAETKTRQLQLWQCKICTHTFYTPVGRKQALYRRLFRRPERIECPACELVTSVKKKIITKEIQEDVEKENTD